VQLAITSIVVVGIVASTSSPAAVSAGAAVPPASSRSVGPKFGSVGAAGSR